MAKIKIQFRPNRTPQNLPILGTNQVPNSAGGYSWAVSQWDRLRRFLVLGVEGGTYYISEKALTIENANAVIACIKEDGLRVVAETVEISQAGRAPKNDPAIFVMALVAAFGDDFARKAAFDNLSKVCRTGTHLFTFAEFVNGLRGWGRGLRRGVAGWYQALEARDLAYQIVKYRQRGGWTHSDTLRLAHPMPENETQGALFKWITHRDTSEWIHAPEKPEHDALAFIWAFEQAQRTTDIKTVIRLIQDFDLPREALPTHWLNEASVWQALLPKMPMTAMIRNLGIMTRLGVIQPMNATEATVIERLTNVEFLRRARIHPIAVLAALRVYKLGHGLRGRQNRSGYYVSDGKRWKPISRVLDALDEAFELAFQNIEPTNKRMLLALDVSGSMSIGYVGGVPGLTPREGAAAMAMVTARSEPNYQIISFQDKIVPLNISSRMRLDDVVEATNGLPFGATDCAQPMIYALEQRIPVETFVIYTDSETWSGEIHPVQALNQYREETGIDSRLIVVAMTSNGFSIADPNDSGMLDLVGFDTASPQIIADFAARRI